MSDLPRVDEAGWDDMVVRSEVPVVVDFWAPWCGPCAAVEPILHDLAARAGNRATFVSVNVDASPALGARYGVLSLPTVTLFAGGEPRASVVGVRSAAHFQRTFADWLG
jgi:thioredoxin 1